MSQQSKKIFAIKDTFVPISQKSQSHSKNNRTKPFRPVKNKKGGLSLLPEQKIQTQKNTHKMNSDSQVLKLTLSKPLKPQEPNQNDIQKPKHVLVNTSPSIGAITSPSIGSIGSIRESSIISSTSFAHQVEGATVIMDAPLYNNQGKVAQALYSCVVCLLGPEELIGQSWPINKTKISVGRSRKCDICIPDPSLSKKHLVLCQDKNNKILIADQNSTNGTLINETKLTANKLVELEDNHKIALGKTVLRFLDKNNPEIVYVQENFEKAFQDPLTEVSNRFALESRAPALFKQSRQYRQPLSLIIFDIDHFKKVNDTYGHLAGDFVLKEVVRVVKPCFRSKDLFARSGGEEFCIIIQSQVQRAQSAIENARQKVEKHLFQYKTKKIQVTISAGVACRQKEDKKWQELYERADKKLYEAKKAGRNKIISS